MYAGKKTNFNEAPKKDDKVVSHLQNSLSALQMDKERVSIFVFYHFISLSRSFQGAKAASSLRTSRAFRRGTRWSWT
jgi:hypothetical protein